MGSGNVEEGAKGIEITKQAKLRGRMGKAKEEGKKGGRVEKGRGSGQHG